MKNVSKTFKTKSFLTAIALVAVVTTSLVGSAHAEWVHGRGGPPSWHERRWDEHVRVVRHPRYEPGYVYAPPPVVYAPPPAETGINLILPLHFN